MTTTTPARSVSRWRAFRLSYRVLLQQVVTPGRVVALSVLGVAMMVVAWAIGASDGIDDRVEAATQLVSAFGLVIVVPVIALVFASGVLGDANEDGTLVYLWLRPMDRGPIVAAGFAAALTAALPLAVIPVTIAGGLAGGGSDVVRGALLASVAGAVCYTAVFVLLGLLIKRSIVWGIAYILIWEGIAAALGTVASRLALRGYTRSILFQITEIPLDPNDIEPVSTTSAVIVCAAVALAALVLATVRLDRLDVA